MNYIYMIYIWYIYMIYIYIYFFNIYPNPFTIHWWPNVRSSRSSLSSIGYLPSFFLSRGCWCRWSCRSGSSWTWCPSRAVGPGAAGIVGGATWGAHAGALLGAGAVGHVRNDPTAAPAGAIGGAVTGPVSAGMVGTYLHHSSSNVMSTPD